MTLKASYEKESDIPEALKSEYVLKDGSWILDAEGMVPASDLTAARTRIDEFRQNNVELNEKLKKFDGKKVLSAEDQQEFDRLIQQQADIDDKKLIDAGKIDELLANRTEQMRTDFEARIESLNNSLTGSKESEGKAVGRLSGVLIRSEVSKLLNDQGIVPVQGAIDDIYTRAQSIWRANDEGVLHAVNGKGDPIYGGEGKELTLAEWGQSLVKDAPFLFAKNDGTGGDGSGTKLPTGNDGIMRIPRTDEAMKSKHIADIASGKAIVVD